MYLVLCVTNSDAVFSCEQEIKMTPAEFKARLKKLDIKPVEQLKPTEQPKRVALGPQCMFERVENGGLVAFYCLEDEGHAGEHRFGEPL